MNHDVLYYHRRIPESYFEGKGWRGWLIRVLNRVRWRLERFVAYRVMLLIAREQGLEPEAVDALKIRFHEENAEVEQKRRRRTLAALGLLAEDTPRYALGRKNTPPPEDATVQSLSRIMAKSRYSHGRDFHSADEAQVEEVPVVDMADS